MFEYTTIITLYRIQNNILPLAPDFLRKQLAQDIFSRHSMVFSNVPGPAEPMYLCGEKLLGMQALFPNLIAQVTSILFISFNPVFPILVMTL